MKLAWQVVYFCRLCCMEDSITVPEEVAWATFQAASPEHGNVREEILNTEPLRLVSSHVCDDNQIGVSDFVGLRRVVEQDATP